SLPSLSQMLLASLALQMVGLVFPVANQILLDRVIGPKQDAWLWGLAFGLGAATIAKALMTLIRSYVVQGLQNVLDFTLMGRFLDHMLHLPLGFFLQREAGDLVQRVQSLRHTPPTSALPLGAVLTLPATGSESNGYAVITRKSTLEKLSFGHPSLFPCFAVLDPEATFSLPPRQVANGVVDAFVHVMEQYLTYPAEAPLQDRLAESILQTLIEVGPRTLAEPQDYEARASLMWCANLALNGLIGAGVPQDWSTHALGHELTALHGIDHGRTLAILLPNLLWVQREGKRAKLLQFAERVWGLREGSEGVRVEGGIVRTREFFESLGVSTHLEDYNPDRDRAEEIVARLERRGVLPLGERKDLDAAKVREILLLCR
ncbi:MAG TPA: iron-containing alcohol dehydrogenase, partial [Holophaga sp.]|nr:iron-containing alcohol dehydrogenase [Holophaga sp.]